GRCAQHSQRRDENQHQTTGGQVQVPGWPRNFPVGRGPSRESRLRNRSPELRDVQFILQSDPCTTGSLEKPRKLQDRRLRVAEEARRRSRTPASGKNRREADEIVARTSGLSRHPGRGTVQVRALPLLMVGTVLCAVWRLQRALHTP